MSLTVDDLRPKTFVIEIRGVALSCKPLSLADAMIINKVSNILQNPESATKESFKTAEADLDEVITSLIPEISFSLDLSTKMEVLQHLMDSVEPNDNKELKENKVSVDTDPKA